jgi:hypothetical protein
LGVPVWLSTKILKQESTHGKHKKTHQRRTKKVETQCAQKSESGKALEAKGTCSRIQEAQSEKDGSGRGEAVTFSAWHLALGPQGLSAEC